MSPRVFDTLVNKVKMYAGLTGNCKRYEIKNSYDNKRFVVILTFSMRQEKSQGTSMP